MACLPSLVVVLVVALVTLVVIGIDALNGFLGGANLFGIYGMALTFPACLVALPLSGTMDGLLHPLLGPVSAAICDAASILASGVLNVAAVVGIATLARQALAPIPPTR